MNILIVDDEWPTEFSGKALRIIELGKKISKLHKVHFLYIGNEKPRNLSLFQYFIKSTHQVSLTYNSNLLGKILNLLFLMPGDFAKWRFKDDYKIVRQKVKEIVVQEDIDCVHVFSYFTAQYFSQTKDCVKIWDVGDSLYLNFKRRELEKDILKRMNAWLFRQKLLHYEKEMISSFDKTIFVSANDALVHNHANHKITTIPNGVDLDYFNSNYDKVETGSLVFTGHMSYGPNVEAAMYFIDKIFPRIRQTVPDSKFYVVGAEPLEELKSLNGKDGVVVTGKVKDIREYLGMATVFVSPMVSGSGIKNKILQAMAMSKPIVSTSLGVEALKITPGKEIIIADSADAFADRVVALLQDIKSRDALGRNARALVEKEYGWDGAVAQYNSLYNDLKQK